MHAANARMQAAEKGSHVQLEAIGCLANLASLPASFDWRPTLQHLQLLPWLKQLLADKAVPQDVTMEALRLCQCLARAPVDMHIAEADMVTHPRHLMPCDCIVSCSELLLLCAPSCTSVS